MNPEINTADGQSKGQEYLDMLDLGALGDVEFEYQGKSRQGRDFLDICPEHAEAVLRGLEAAQAERSPDFPMQKEVVKQMVAGVMANHLGIDIKDIIPEEPEA